MAITNFRTMSAFANEPDREMDKSSLSNIFAEEPVDLNTFIQDKKFLGQTGIQLSPKQAMAVQVIERVYYPEIFPLMAEEFEFGEYWGADVPSANLITLQWGKGSGKDAICRWASLRVAYLLLCLKSPQLYFEMPETDSIHLLNIAANAPQANRAFFKPMTTAVKHGWFKGKAQIKQGEIEYDKNVFAVSGHSDAEGQEGLNIMLGVADEIDAFKAKDEMVGTGKKLREASTSAESILEMLKTSASTRFPETYKRVAISYPRYLGSTIQQLTAEGNASNEKYGEKSIHYVSGPWATWDVNPRVKGKHQFQEDYDTDPDKAAAKYECKPTRAMDPFFRNMSIFQQSVDHDEQPLTIDYKVNEYYSKHTRKVTQGWEPVFHFSPDFKPIQGAHYALHGDLALKGDRAGIAMSHIEKWEENIVTLADEDGSTYQRVEVRPRVRNDFTIAFEAKADAKDDQANPLPREIQIRWVRMLAYELINRGFPIGLFTFDSYQSADTIQIFNTEGIESDKMSTDKDPSLWGSLKDIASENRLRFAFDQLLMNELESLSRLDNGKVDHPPNGSKDLADAFCCSIAGALILGGEEDPDGAIVDVGGEYFAAGQALSPLYGMDEIADTLGDPMGMPLGFPDRGTYGW
jgi:hypothetical protein